MWSSSYNRFGFFILKFILPSEKYTFDIFVCYSLLTQGAAIKGVTEIHEERAEVSH